MRMSELIIRKIKIPKFFLPVIVMLFTFFVMDVTAQNLIKVTGEVTNPQGEELIGVSVYEKNNTKNGVVTDIKGRYAITLNENAILVFSYIGHKTIEINVSGKKTINVELAEDAIALQEVIAVGYGSMRKSDLTGAISTVGGDKLTITPLASTQNALVGQIPGLVSRQLSGEPGSDGAGINIRGFGQPLIIVDGVEQALTNIDPNTIESVTVLKDASAAIYGARAGNGVVLVTTKRGLTGKPVFNVSSSYTLQGVTRYPKLLSSGQFTELVLEGQMNDNIPEAQWTYSPEDVQKYYDGTDPNYYPNTDWWKLTVRDWAPLQQNNLSIRGGNDKIRYFGSFGSLSQEGFIKTGDNVFKRFNIQSNIDADITDNLIASLDMSLINSNLQGPSRDAQLVFQDLFTTEPMFPYAFPDPTKIPLTGASSPIINSSIDIGGYNRNITSSNRMSGTLEYKFPFVKGLSAKAYVSYIQNNIRTKHFQKNVKGYTYNYETDTYYEAGQTAPTTLTEGRNYNQTITSQFSLNYKRIFKKHNVNGLFVYEVIDQKGENISGSRRNYLTSSIDYLFAGGTEDQRITGSGVEFGRMGYIGRFNYSYDSKYLLQFTGRYDASPRFAPEHRWGFFPSVSAAWRISEESFLKENSTISNLKMRLSYSNSGYDATGNFQYLTGYNLSKGNLFNGSSIPGLVSTGLANEFITWEEMSTYNAGLDFGLFKNRLYGELDVFYRLRDGILANRLASLPNTFGASLPSENLNAQSNRGFELMLGTVKKTGALKYTIEANVSWTRAKWESFDEPDYTDPDDIRIKQNTGNWTNRFFGYKSDGLFTSQEEIEAYELDQDLSGNSTIRPGDIKYVDISGPDGIPDGRLDWRDQVQIGLSAVPEIFFGLSTSLQYNNFDLYVLLQGATRSDIRVSPERYTQDRGVELAYLGRWSPENNRSDATFPRRSSNQKNNSYISDFWVVDGSYVRLKTLSIGYSIPTQAVKKLGIDKVKFSVSGTNLLTIDKVGIFGYDPEVPQGSNGFYYPQQRTISAGVNLTF